MDSFLLLVQSIPKLVCTKYLYALLRMFSLFVFYSFPPSVLPESIYPFGQGKTLSLPNCSSTNLWWWDDILNLILRKCDWTQRPTRHCSRGQEQTILITISPESIYPFAVVLPWPIHRSIPCSCLSNDTKYSLIF